MKPSCGREANILGALATGVGDVVNGVAASETAHAGATPGALVAIGHAPGLSIDELSRVVSLSHPGTVRLVDRLSDAGLVERQQGRDRRSLSLKLTDFGWDRRAAVLAARGAQLDAALAVFSPEERGEFGRLAAKLLTAMPKSPLHALSICRLCDEIACADCPVDAASGG